MKKNYWTLNRILAFLILFLFSFSEATAGERVQQDPTQDAIISGATLFDGSTRLANDGPSCISCHNVNTKVIVSGGLLAKDLTNVYTRMGDAGLSGILGAPPFPAMASAYRNNKMTEKEIEDLKAFLQFVDTNSSGQPNVNTNIASGNNDEIFLIYGPIGLIVWLVMVYFFWFNRKKESVKKAVFDRQIKPIN